MGEDDVSGRRSKRKLQAVASPGDVRNRPGRPGRNLAGRPPTPEAKVEEIRALLADPSLSRNEIARRAGVSGYVVTRIATEIGRVFRPPAEVADTRAATAAHSASATGDRRALAEDLSSAVAEIMSQLRELLPAKDTRATGDLSRAAAALVRAAVDLDRLEIDRQRAASAARGGSEVDSWLDEMTGTDGQG